MTQDAFRSPTTGTKSREVFDLIVNEGWDMPKAARWVGVAFATGERIVEKYVNWNRMIAAERRVKELEQELAALKGMKP